MTQYCPIRIGLLISASLHRPRNGGVWTHPPEQYMHCDLTEELKEKTSAYEKFLSQENLSEQTRRAYVSRIKGFRSFLETYPGCQQTDMQRALREIAQSFHDHLVKDGAKPSSVNASITAVYHFYSYLGHKVPPVLRDWVLKTDPRVLSTEEQDRLILSIAAQSSVRDRALVTLLLFTGIRIGECRELTVGNVEISAHTGRIVVSSRKRSRSIPLNTVTRQAMLAWLIERTRRFDASDERPLFPNKSGEFMTRAAIDEVVRKVGRFAHLNICAQVLRNTCLTALLERGNTLELVAEFGGQSKLEHVRRFRKDKAAGLNGAMVNAAFENPWTAFENLRVGQ